MTDIVLNNITSGYNISKMNSNFNTIKNSINTDVLNLVGGNNILQQDIDLNSNDLLNVSIIDAEVVRINGEPITTSQFVVGPGVIGDNELSPNGLSSSKINFKQTGAGSVQRSVQDKLLDTVSVFDWMTPAQINDVRNHTNSIDVTAALQACFTASAGKQVILPTGIYKITAPLILPVATYLLGDGNKATYLYFTLASGSTARLISINAGAPSGVQYGGGIANIGINDFTPNSFTTGIYVEDVVGAKFENINLTNMSFGMSFLNGSNIIINLNISNLSNPTTAVGVMADGLQCGLGITDSIIQSSTVIGEQISIGYYFTGGASPTMHAANTYGCSIGCRINAVGVSTYWPQLIGCQFDTASDTGLLLDCGVGGNIYGLIIEDLWSSTFDGYGVHISPGAGTINGVSINGGRIYANKLGGIFIEGGNNLKFNNLELSGNGNFTNPAVSVQGPTSNLSFIGGRYGPSAQFGSTQLYGILFGTYAISNVIIDGIDLSGNINDGFLSTSTTPVSVYFGNNIGYSANTPIAPTLLNSWVNFGSGQDTVGYYKDSSGTVRLKGLIKSGTLGATAFILPVGFRPAEVRYFACWSNSAFGGCNVGSDGQVSIANGSNVSFSLAGISFKAEQ